MMDLRDEEGNFVFDPPLKKYKKYVGDIDTGNVSARGFKGAYASPAQRHSSDFWDAFKHWRLGLTPVMYQARCWLERAEEAKEKEVIIYYLYYKDDGLGVVITSNDYKILRKFYGRQSKKVIDTVDYVAERLGL